jgi:hypothetical protein
MDIDLAARLSLLTAAPRRAGRLRSADRRARVIAGTDRSLRAELAPGAFANSCSID